MKIAALYYYPVKSLPGVATDSLCLDRFGPAGDRRWMIVGADGRFVTQRKHPTLARVSCSLGGDGVWITVPGEGRFPLVEDAMTRSVTVWKDAVEARQAEPGAGEALSRFLGLEVEFVYMPEDTTRLACHDGLGDRHPVSFADGFPFLVTNMASLADLNRRLPRPADIRRFRPNIVVEGADAWAEDHWRQLSIAGVTLDLVKPCSRCNMTTVDPDTGARARDGEPLKTLAAFRTSPDGVLFGVNAVYRGSGAISVGDPITVLDTKESDL
ncbi:hypothetical protein SAMN05216203_0253 [Marinobacter daqiaonensis]|uniref:MOSC domain-containing protein n=1 Tax=Marinobacter daqiaonensis TaxID=650891 RepID=A0A1I6GLW7_9GAMM|nr:MOSC domain-containing protein [Marinobacter daqiaonensis]SFR43170.1 hypothetical protein SAMN05216203_0253 [Marinobacter daqiaonensis]